MTENPKLRVLVADRSKKAAAAIRARLSSIGIDNDRLVHTTVNFGDKDTGRKIVGAAKTLDH
jgi:type IV pilus biogenesis protein CpaD/CtpE